MNMGGTVPHYKKKRGKKSTATDCGRGDVFQADKNSSSETKGTDSNSAGLITSGGDNSSLQTTDSQQKNPENLEANENEEGKTGTDEAEVNTEETKMENGGNSMESVQKGEQCEGNSTIASPADPIMTEGGCEVTRENESKFLGDGREALMESENDDSKSVEIKDKNGELSESIKETDQIDAKSDQADGIRHPHHDVVNETISSQGNANLSNTEDSVDKPKGSNLIIITEDIPVIEQESNQTGMFVTDHDTENKLTESIVEETVKDKNVNLHRDDLIVTEEKTPSPEDSLTPTSNTSSECLLKEESKQGELGNTLTEEINKGCPITEKPNPDELPANKEPLTEEIRKLKSKSKSFNMEDQFIVQHQSLASKSMSDGNITNQEILKQSGDVKNNVKVSLSDGEVLRSTQGESSEMLNIGNINSSKLSKNLGQKREETPDLNESESSSSKIEEQGEVIQHERDEDVDTQPFLPTTEEEPLTKFGDAMIETETTNSAVTKATELEGMEDGGITDSQLCSLDWDNGTQTQSTDIPTEDISDPARVVSPCPETSQTSELADGTKVVQGLIKELTALNQTLVKTKKEMEAARKNILK